MNQEEVSQSLRRVERAIENIHAYMGAHLDDSKGEAKRRHTRYEKKALLAKVQFRNNPLIKEEEIVEARVLDVSAGGMCVVLPSKLRVRKQDEFKFVVYTNNGKELVIKGSGKVVRLTELGEEREVGVKFSGAVEA